MEKSIAFFLLVELLLIILIYRIRRRKPFVNYLLVVASVLATLLITEVVYRQFIKKEDPVNTHNSQPGTYAYDSILGIKPGRAGTFTAISMFPSGDTVFKATYTIIHDTSGNDLSYNHRAGFSNPSGNTELIFLGCSFTFGEGVSDSSTLPYLAGKKMNLSSVNLGCPGYGSHQVYELFKRWYATSHNQNRVFVYSFLSDHFLRANGVYNWNANGPYLVRENDSLIYRGSLAGSEKARYRRLPYYFSGFGAFHFIEDNLENILLKQRISDFGQADYNRCLLMLKKMATYISQTGGRLIILNWDKENWGYRGYDFIKQDQLDRDVMALANDRVKVIPVSSILDLNNDDNFIPYDGHPGPQAYLQIAARLIDTLAAFH